MVDGGVWVSSLREAALSKQEDGAGLLDFDLSLGERVAIARAEYVVVEWLRGIRRGTNSAAHAEDDKIGAYCLLGCIDGLTD